VLQSEDASAALQRGTRRTLIAVLESLLRLIHPLMPFVTEEIWQQVAPRAGITGATIMLQPYPAATTETGTQAAVADIEWVRQFILGIRQIRGEMDISPGKALPVVLQGAGADDRQRAQRYLHLLQRVGRVASVDTLQDDEQPPPAATALLGAMRLLVPMQGLIDVDAERSRLEKQLQRVNVDLARTRGKLDNASFLNNAPADVVTLEKQRALEFAQAIEQLTEQLEKLAELATID
jgi:valyl-tRNA synthetase